MREEYDSGGEGLISKVTLDGRDLAVQSVGSDTPIASGVPSCSAVNNDSNASNNTMSDQGVINRSDYEANDELLQEGATKLDVSNSKVSILHWNVGGIASKLLDSDFVDYICSFDVISLVETFVENLESTLLNDYAVFVKPALKFTRRGRHSGGIVCMIKKGFLPLVRKVDCACANHMCFVLDKSLFGVTNDVLFICVYVHPENSPFYTAHDIVDGISCLEDCIADTLLTLNDVDIMLCGDLNGRTSNIIPIFLDTENLHHYCNSSPFHTLIRHSEDAVLNSYGKKLYHMCSTLGLCMFNGLCNGDPQGRYTYICNTGSSVNDYFLASWDLFDCLLPRCNLNIAARIESDHMPLEFIIDRESASADDCKDETDVPQQIEKYQWNGDFANAFYVSMTSEEANSVFDRALNLIDADVNAALGIFNDFVKRQAVSMKKIIYSGKKGKSEWFDKECRDERRNVRMLLRRFRKCQNEVNRVAYCRTRREYKNLLFRKKKLFNDLLFNKLVSSIDDQQAFWQTMSKINCKRTQPKHEITVANWYDHFKTVLEKDIPDVNGHQSDDPLFDEVYEEVLDGPITRDEVVLAIRKLKLGKSPGPDGLIGEFFKYSGNNVVDFLVKLFNKLFDNGMYPDEWKETIILPLFKKGNVNDTNNYRGISLCNVSSKLYSAIINSRLQKWVSSNNITGEHQAGFKTDYSTVDHMFALLAAVQKQLVQNRKLYVAFVDFEKAFDSINRKLLWPILLKCGVKGKLYHCIKTMYADVKAKVRSGAKFTECINCTQGVKQGDVCSPILFSLFINELALEIIENGRHGVTINLDLIELFILLFADDIVLLAVTIVGLQSQLNNLNTAATRLELKVNMGKTGIVVFRKGGHLAARERWFYDGERVPVMNAYKYLGIYFSTRLSFSYACQDLMSRAKKAVLGILHSMFKFQNNSVDVFIKLFDTQVQPIVQYGAEIWGIDKGREIEKVHMFAIKRFLHVHGRTPNDIVYGELGRFPMYVNSYVACARYWLRLLRMEEHRLPFKCYRMLYDLDCRGKVTWATNIRKCLSSYGFFYVWEYQGVGCIKTFLKCFKQRLIDCRWQEWDSHLQESDRFSLYRTFKTTNCIEPYNYLNVNRYVKNALTKFRCGVSSISVHARRYKYNTIDNMLCRLCGLYREDEIHFVLCCPCLSDLRSELIPSRYYNYPTSFRLALLLSSTNTTVLKNVAIYLYFAFKRLSEVAE